MSYTYSEFNTALATYLVVPDYATNAGWAIVLPRIIEQAEQRIYRELDLITTQTSASVAAVAGTRTVTVPGSILIVESVNAITPASTAADAGTRNPLRRASTEFINSVWPSASTQGVPRWYDMKDFTTIILAPTPDAAYNIECYGTIRPAPLSGSNTTTFLTTYLPDLFFAAAMVAGAGYQRDYGAQSDDPKLAISWEEAYQTAKASAAVEEARRKSQSVGWQALEPAPLAKPER